MNFIKKLFGGNDSSSRKIKGYSEGDIFYIFENEKYYVYKILLVENPGYTYHVMTYNPLDYNPTIDTIESLEIAVYHSPFAPEVFNKGIFIGNEKVKSGDLIGYHEYLRQTRTREEYLIIANNYYLAAHQLTDERKHEDAIDYYSRAIDLYPNFFEAIDNRAFCQMDLGRWEEAIKDFENSLQVKPGSLLAVFSIGECYYKMGDYKTAKVYFEKAHEIDPRHEAPVKYLEILLHGTD